MSVVLEQYFNGVTYISEGFHLEIAEHYLSLALSGHVDSISLYNPVGGYTIVVHCGSDALSRRLSPSLAAAMLRGLNLPPDSFDNFWGSSSGVKD